MDVSQPEIAAGIAISQLLVIEAQSVQNRRVQIVDAGAVFDRLETELVGGSVLGSPFDASARHPDAETPVVVVATEA